MTVVLVECHDGQFIGVGGFPFGVKAERNLEIGHTIVVSCHEYDAAGLVEPERTARMKADAADLAAVVAERLRNPALPGVLRRSEWLRPWPPAPTS